MLDFFGLDESEAVRQRDGLYYAKTFGSEGRRLQVIMLDTRWYRSSLKKTDDYGAKGKERYLPDPTPSKTMLGEAQWAWLEGELKKPADVRLLVSSQQVIADGHGWEAWRNLPAERAKLYDLIESTGATGVVMLSGDRHVGGLYENSIVASYPLIELTSSSLNLAFNNEPDETGPYQVGQLYGPANFGMVEIDWDAGMVYLKLHSVEGQEVRGLSVPIETLRKPNPTRLQL